MTREQQLSDLQLAVMRVLWDRGEATAAAVQESIAPERRLALTTISTLLSRLERRKLVGHRNEGRQFVYAPLVDEGTVLHADVDDLTKRWFAGDAAALMSHLLDVRGISPGDLEKVRALLESRGGRGGKRRGNR